MSKIKYIALLGLFLVGCRQHTTPSVPDPSEIRLTSGVRGVVSKAGVFDGDRFSAQVCGWVGATAALDWSQAATWTSGAEVLAGSTASAMELMPSRLYSLQGLITVVRAWHPAGTLAGGKVSFDNPRADLDVMLSNSVSGTTNTPISSALIFNHLTTQFRFVLTGSWFVEEPIVSIVVRGVRVPVGLDLASGSLVGGAAVDLAVSGVAEGGVLPSAAGVAFGQAMLVLPIEGNKIYVDIVTPVKSYKNIEVTTTDTQFTAGRAYTVTLSFQGGQQIAVGSEVEDWLNDGQSSGDLR